MTPQRIVIANAASARILRRDAAIAPPVQVATPAHPANRLQARALGADRLGSYATDDGHGPNHFKPHSDARRIGHRRFAKETAQLSEAATRQLTRAQDADLSHRGLAELDRRISGAWSAPR